MLGPHTLSQGEKEPLGKGGGAKDALGKVCLATKTRSAHDRSTRDCDPAQKIGIPIFIVESSVFQPWTWGYEWVQPLLHALMLRG